ncbi:MAG TPA: histidinol dehydrogenase [Candidatus Lokiarchaeia archaeon]|nr:histidinol dehydrogenase [Candidatus Lokiarchaeia archaeon]
MNNINLDRAMTMNIKIRIKQLSEISLAELRSATIDQARVDQVKASVQDIIGEVRARGDEAVLEFTRKFDGVEFSAPDMRVPESEIDDALNSVDGDVIEALQAARANIEKYHAREKPEEWQIETTEGVTPSLITRPLGTVGIYVPGGKAFYPSTVLMCAVPAIVAGVERIVMATPPRKDGQVEPIVLASAKIAGITEIYKIGGAQAIAALAIGTETIPKVDAIVGPGNAYVSMAKQLLQGEVIIDSPAGPSEVLVVAGEDADPKLTALDICAQAEHDEDAVAMALVTSNAQAIALAKATNDLVPTLDRKAILKASLEKNGLIIVLGKNTMDEDYANEAASVINAIAPEHLQLSLDDATITTLLPLVKNAGAIFLGENSPVPLGDYASGTNHVLPTSGNAKRYSALNTTNFIKYIPVTRASKDGLKNLARTVSTLARFEKLDGHARCVEDRVND